MGNRIFSFLKRRLSGKLTLSPFVSHRLFAMDAAYLAVAFISPRLLSLFLLLAYRGYSRQLGISRKAALKNIFISPPQPFKDYEAYKDAWLISPRPHMREQTMLKVLGQKITCGFTMNGKGREMFEAKNIPLFDMPFDWIAVWLLILANYEPRRLFILSGLDDVWFLPLKLHMFTGHIAVDSYDPMGEYIKTPLRQFLTILNYKLGKNYIVRDARFKKALRRSDNRTANVCWLPDATPFDVMDRATAAQKFQDIRKIKFVSGGWVTSYGDGGILRSFQLIRALWPNAEIHLCLTQFMSVEHPYFAPLVSFMNGQEGCFVHENLQGDAYRKMLADAHVGVNLHDPNVFGEKYTEFATSMIRRSPSARVLDFAAMGCVLMTTKEHRFSEQMFKLYSPHKGVIHLSSGTKPEELTDLFRVLQERCS
jgi:hypothetical protein